MKLACHLKIGTKKDENPVRILGWKK